MSAVIEWKHDALAEDLAAHLRGYARPAMIWTDMQLGPAGSPRPDVYTIEPTYQRLAAMAYEIKVSRSDFQRDVQAGKYTSYLRYAGAVAFAVPKGLVAKAEIPPRCGLIERSDTGWRWSKKPTISAVENLPMAAWMKLLIDGAGRDCGAGRVVKERSANQWHQQQRARKLLGTELGQLLADRDHAMHKLQFEIDQCQTKRAGMEDLRRKMEEADRARAEAAVAKVLATIREVAVQLGLDENAPTANVIRELRKLTPEGQSTERQRAANELRNAMRQIERSITVLEGGAE